MSEKLSLWKELKCKFSQFSNEHEFGAIIIIYSFLRNKKQNYPNTHFVPGDDTSVIQVSYFSLAS